MIYDFFGMAGVVLLLIAYYQIQTGKVTIDNVSYSWFNLVGSSLIVVSLMVDFNLSAFAIEVAWIVISLIGLVRYYKK